MSAMSSPTRIFSSGLSSAASAASRAVPTSCDAPSLSSTAVALVSTAKHKRQSASVRVLRDSIPICHKVQVCRWYLEALEFLVLISLDNGSKFDPIPTRCEV